MRAIAFAAILMIASCSGDPALAHDVWNNGDPVPAWVKASCCGPEDVHHLKPEQVHEVAGKGWKVDGYPDVLPYGKELPSQDGDYWIFYKVNSDRFGTTYSPVYCFFTPPRSF